MGQRAKQWKEHQELRLGKRAVVSRAKLDEEWARTKKTKKARAAKQAVRAAKIQDKADPVKIAKASQQIGHLQDAVQAIAGDTLERIRADMGDCKRCKLHTGRTNLVFGEGSSTAKVMFVGEGPGEQEDLTGRPFVGKAGQLLTKIIEAMGFKREDVYIANVVKSRPPGNRAPEPDEVAACSPFLFRQIDVVNPEVIVALGGTAVKCLFGDKAQITKMRGQFIEFRGRKLMPTFHPAYLLRNPPAKKEVWDDMKKVMAELKK